MIYQRFIQQELNEVNLILGREWDTAFVFMSAGMNTMGLENELNNRILAFNDVQENARWHIWRIHQYAYGMLGESGLRAYMDDLKKAMDSKIESEKQYSYILPFWSYYETRWNDRKGYSELVFYAKKTWNNIQFGEKIKKNEVEQIGQFMAALIDCYYEMTEEAYDQRELFAQLLRECVAQVYAHKHQLFSAPANWFLLTYAILKSIRLGVLRKEKYEDFGNSILLWIEMNGFSLMEGKLSLRNDENSRRWEQTFSCMLAWGEYEALQKGKTNYGF